MKEFSSETPMKKEGALRFFEFPVRPIRRIFQVTETQVERDDNIIMAIEGVTEKEEFAFELEELQSQTRVGGFYTRLELDIYASLDLNNIER